MSLSVATRVAAAVRLLRSAEHVRVDVPGRHEGFLQVAAEILVVERAIDVRAHGVGCVVEPVLRLGHSWLVLSSRSRRLSVAVSGCSQTGGQRAGAAACRSREAVRRRREASASPEKAFASTSSIESTSTKESWSRVSCGSSSRSGSFSRGTITRFRPARCAASTFSRTPPIGEHLAGERDLAGHADVLGHGLAPGERGDRRRHRDPGGRAVLRHRAGRNVDVDVVLREPLRLEPDASRVRARPRERGLRRFLHHLAELAGDLQPSLARERRRLDEQDVAADGGVGEPCRDARIGRSLAGLAGEAARAQPLANLRFVDLDPSPSRRGRRASRPCGGGSRSGARGSARPPRACTPRSSASATCRRARPATSSARARGAASGRGSAWRSRASRRGCSRRGGSRPSGRAAEPGSCRACSRCR